MSPSKHGACPSSPTMELRLMRTGDNGASTFWCAMKRSAFSMVELLIVMLIVATLMALIVPAVWRLRQAADRTQNTRNLKILTLGMHGLNDVHKRLPPATGDFGDPRFNATFHVHLMPFIEQDNPYKAI